MKWYDADHDYINDYIGENISVETISFNIGLNAD